MDTYHRSRASYLRAQRAYDAMEPPDYYDPPDDDQDDDELEPEDEQDDDLKMEPIMDFRGNVVGFRRAINE